MSYESVDQLQKVLTEEVFHYAGDSKKAAGLALGTLVEIVTFYALKSWGFEKHIAIERPLPEFANSDITHNVEYSLHPSTELTQIEFTSDDLPLTSRKIVGNEQIARSAFRENSIKNNTLLDRNRILRNSCTVCESRDRLINAYLEKYSDGQGLCSVVELLRHPFAIVECKRVGVEDGMRKGPQTIEKAKQGAYVARTVSALQKIRLSDGSIGGLIQKRDGSFLVTDDYYELMADIISSKDSEFLRRFIMTIGVVSNHGNWFTSENHNKELKVLAQSYDWLLFLTDRGIVQFVDDLLLNPGEEFIAAKEAFLASYTGNGGGNQFTKVKISLAADYALQKYFRTRRDRIETWFNIIAPAGKQLAELKSELDILKRKDWLKVHL